MRRTILAASALIVLTLTYGTSYSQTNCIWIENSNNGATTSIIGISHSLAKVFAGTKGNFNLEGVHLSFDTLLYAYRTGKTIQVTDSTGSGVARIYGGKFKEPMEKSANEHHYLVVENTDSNGTVKVTKLRTESVQAVGIILAMIAGENLDYDLDKIESVLKPGGILYISDPKKNSRVWIYVN